MVKVEMETETIDHPHDISDPAPAPAPTHPPQLKDKPLRERVALAVGGFLLSTNAGFINGVCLNAVNGYTVSHLSGTTTKAGLHAADGQGTKFGIDVGLIFCFTIGSAISGFIMPGNNFKLTNGYGPLFIISSTLLFIACGLQATMHDSIHYFYVAAMACGLQNAMTTKYSGSIIRTTHVTGTFTDIGIVIGRLFRKRFRVMEDAWKLQLLLPLAMGFFLGGLFASAVYKQLGKYSLILSAFFMTGIGLSYVLYMATYTKSIWLAIVSTEKEFESFVREKVEQSSKAFNSKKELATANLQRFTNTGARSDSPIPKDTDVSNPLHWDVERSQNP